MSRFIKYADWEEAVIIMLLLITLIFLISRVYKYIHGERKKDSIKDLISQICMYLFITAVFIIVFHFKYNNCDLYEKGVQYETYGNYVEAMKIYKEIRNFSDCKERIERIHDEYYYQLGHQYLYEKKYLGAAACFSQCVFYGDSYEYLQISMDAYLEEGHTLNEDPHIYVE